ncbi:MAG: hypothetical protein K2N30_02565 [Clostridia bacterium]|nr:hypothetical protein [Clostridia bacterium]
MKTILLKTNSIGRYDDVSPFIVTDNQLEIKAVLPNFNGEFYLVAENNGKTYKKLLLREGNIFLDELTAGELNAEVKHYLKGEHIKSYKIEPLLLKEVDGRLFAVPEIIGLKDEISNLKAEIAELQEKLSALNKSFTEYKNNAELREIRANENVLALIRFAFKDYKDNVYLGGGSIEEFISEFGFDLWGNEVNEITGGKGNDEI